MAGKRSLDVQTERVVQVPPSSGMGDGRFPPGSSGNLKGRPAGSRNKTTMACQSLLEQEGEAITRRALGLALEGHPLLLRLCLERLVPRTKERRIQLDLPVVQRLEDIPRAMARVLEAVGSGEITPGEGHSLATLIALQGRSIGNVDFEARLTAMERILKCENSNVG